MKKCLSYCKIRCFVRIAMLKKTSAAVKTCIVFSIDSAMFFRQKSMQSRLKSMKIGFVHRNQRKSTFGKSFFSKKTIFARVLESLWVPGSLPGRPGSLPESFNFCINFQLRLKTGPDGPPGGPREAPGVPGALSGYHFGSNFGSILHVKKHRKNIQY